MTRLTDGKKTVEITMYEERDGVELPDWSFDFFETGRLELDEEKDAYIVGNVDYCIEQAMDWKDATGEWEDGTGAEDRYVKIM